MKLVFQGEDSWGRPVYKDERGVLWKDVDPRTGYEPNLCMSVDGSFDGEPCDNMNDIKGYEGVELEFIPHRILWY